MTQITPENIKIYDRIHIGNNFAIVSQIYELNRVEVVYLDRKNRAINEDVHFKNGEWTFLSDSPSGGYADNYSRLNDAVEILRYRK